MAVEAIQNNNTYNNSKRMSVAGCAAFGALTGYTLKWALPITSQERDEKYNSELAKVAKNAWQIRNAEKETIAKSKFEGVDTFIKMDRMKNLTLSEIEKLKEPKRTDVKNLLSKINQAGFVAKSEGKKALNTATKMIRPTLTFTVAGMFIAGLISLIYNNIERIETNP